MVYRNSSTWDYDIYALTETWLQDGIVSSEYFDSSFNVFRKDRNQTGSSNNRCGGVLIAIRSHFACSEVSIDNSTSIECICVKIKLNNNTNVFIFNSYVPPTSPKEIYQLHYKAINSVHASCRASDIFILTGDFNIPHASWVHEDENSNILLPEYIEPEYSASFVGDIMLLGLHQVNNIQNSNDRLLDLVFTNDPDNLQITKPPPLVNSECHHPPILLTFEWHFNVISSELATPAFNFSRGDYIGLNQFLDTFGLVSQLKNHHLSLEDKVTLLMDTLNVAVNRFIPRHTKNYSVKCPWSNGRLRKLKNKRNKEWKKFISSGDRRSFDAAFAEFDALNTIRYDEFISNMATTVQSNPKSFWRLVNSRKKTDNIPKILHYDDTSTANAQVQVDLFAKFFSTNFKSSNHQIKIVAIQMHLLSVKSKVLVMFSHLKKFSYSTSS